MLAWPSLFATGGTFAISAARAEKECAFIGFDLKWRTRTASIVRRGLSEAGDSPFSPNPAIPFRQLHRSAYATTSRL